MHAICPSVITHDATHHAINTNATIGKELQRWQGKTSKLWRRRVPGTLARQGAHSGGKWSLWNELAPQVMHALPNPPPTWSSPGPPVWTTCKRTAACRPCSLELVRSQSENAGLGLHMHAQGTRASVQGLFVCSTGHADGTLCPSTCIHHACTHTGDGAAEASVADNLQERDGFVLFSVTELCFVLLCLVK